MTTPPPLTARRWLAGLIEIAGDLAERVAYLWAHVGDGLQAAADHLAPAPPKTPTPEPAWTAVVDGDHIHYLPTRDSIPHDRTDDCACGPSMRCEQTGRGDVWHIRHHRLTPDTEGA